MKNCYNHTISHLKTKFKIQIIPKILSTSTQDTQMVHMTWHKGGSPLFKEKHPFSLSFLFQCGTRKGANPSFLLSFWNWERCNPNTYNLLKFFCILLRIKYVFWNEDVLANEDTKARFNVLDVELNGNIYGGFKNFGGL